MHIDRSVGIHMLVFNSITYLVCNKSNSTVLLVEPTLSEHLNSHPVFEGFASHNLSFIICSFVIFLLAVVLSVLTVSD